MRIFRLPKTLENEIKNFRAKKTKLIFHFRKFSNENKSYKNIYIPSQKKLLDIKGKSIAIDYIDLKYPFKYNVAEEIILMGENRIKKLFVIVVNKYVENQYNIIIDIFENCKTYSLEVVFYAKIKKFLKEIEDLDFIKMYEKENYLTNTLRFNIINSRREDLYNIYYINMENDKKLNINDIFFESLKENLLLNIIYSNDKKITFRRIYENSKEIAISHLNEKEINLLKKLYDNIIKNYINVSLEDDQNIINLKNEFISFDKENGYKEEIDEKSKILISHSNNSYTLFQVI